MKEREKKPSYTDGVRELSRQILETSGDILSIDAGKIEDLAQRLKAFEAQTKTQGNLFANEELSAEDELGLNLYLDVVNFCYMDPVSGEEYTYKDGNGKVKKRSTGLKAAMADSGIHWGSVYDVFRLAPGDWERITQLGENKNFYLGAERGRRIMYFARTLRDVGFKKASDLIEFGSWDCERILHFLSESGYFNDEFAKRSQLAVSMMDGVLGRRFRRNIEGTDSLTVMADYRLPQVMYNLGVIELNEETRATLYAQKIIESGSRQEAALRAAAIVIGTKLSAVMGIPENRVDTLLWSLSQDMAKSGQLEIPHMVVATDKY